MTWLDVSLKGKLMMTLESAGVVKENPTVKKDREFNQIVDNWLKRPIQLPHGGVLSVIASPYLTINLKPKNPEK